jgi:polyhydroxyalkanoate synthesis regulator phasin
VVRHEHKITVDIFIKTAYINNMMEAQENKMTQELREALDDADKWYELYLGQKLANERLVVKIEELESQVNDLNELVYGSPDGN